MTVLYSIVCTAKYTALYDKCKKKGLEIEI